MKLSKTWQVFIQIASCFAPFIEEGNAELERKIKGNKMISQKAFAGSVAIFVAMIGFGVWHVVDHPTPETPSQPPVDTHVHDYYYDGAKDNPNVLIKRHNETYGIPKVDVKHRHTGADYIQGSIMTWKHLNDQHQKLEGK